MKTTLDIDDALMRKAMRLSGLTTKKAVVEAALRLFIQTRSQRVKKENRRGIHLEQRGRGTLFIAKNGAQLGT